MSVNAQSYNHHNLQNHHTSTATHFAQLNTFQQHSTILHHPQPMSFGHLLHPTPILPTSGISQHSTFSAATSFVSKFTEEQKFSEQPKFNANFEPKFKTTFDFPSINSNFYKPFSSQSQHSPSNSKSTISIDSSSASTVSERIMSPHSTVDSHSGQILTSPPPAPSSPSSPINVTFNQNNQTPNEPKVSAQFSISSTSSASPLASITNGNILSPASQQTARANMQNGLLDILMCPDKYQELIQYHQVQNSIIFPSLHHAAYPIDAMNSPRLPTWEFLQVSHSDVCVRVYVFYA